MMTVNQYEARPNQSFVSMRPPTHGQRMRMAAAGRIGPAGLRCLRIALLVGVVVMTASAVGAQNWSFDARRIALGGVGNARNPALELVEEQRGYGTIVVPLGLLQILGDLSIHDPGSDTFDPVRVVENLASPLHYTFGRDGIDSGQRLVSDLVNARISSDLNAYRGFQPASEFFSEGLAAPSWGKTFRFREDAYGSFQGVYVGGGPYMSIRTENRIDESLIDLLGRDVAAYEPNVSFSITDDTVDQLALAITGGYRARFPLPGRGRVRGRDGLYIAADYNYLYGFHYDDFDLDIRFDTDEHGLLAVAPRTLPLSISRITADQGRGLAIDVGLAFVIDRWDFGFAATGLANRITWTDVGRESYELESLFDGGDFVSRPRHPMGADQRVELPVNYSGSVAYHADDWSAIADYSNGFQDNNFNGGVEYRVGPVEVRGGGRFTRDIWHPSAGVGFNLSPGWGVDLGVFGTSTNVERRRNMAVAVSFRLNPSLP